MFVYFHGGFTVAATSEDDGGRERKKVYCNEMGRVHLILNLYRGGRRHYTPRFGLFRSELCVSKRTRRNALACISIIREQVAFGKFAGRQGDVYTRVGT